MKNDNRNHRIRNFLKRLRNNTAGAAFVEFALVFPIITLATVGTLEVGMTMVSTILLEGAISEASRSGMTGYVAAGSTRAQYINNLLQERTFGIINLSNLVITQKVYETFGEVNLPEPYTDTDGDGSYTSGVDSYTDLNCNNIWDADVGADGLGGPGQIVLYQAVYDANFMTGFFSKAIGNADGKIKLTASTVIQNEPYGTPPPGCVIQVKI